LQDLRIFNHVTRDHKFKDEELYYRFTEDEEKKGGSLPEDVSSWSQFLSDGGESNTEILQPRLRESHDEMIGALDELEVKPLDQHNIHLLDQVHPPKWQNPTPEGTYNVVVIGAGCGGLVTAAATAGLGGRGNFISVK